MHLVERVFLSEIKNLNCFENNPHVAIGVSGGPDSMALLFILNKWIKLMKGHLIALIFNHSIRQNSKKESLYVKKILDDLKINSVILKPNNNKLIKKNMADARLNRYDGFQKICKKKNILHLFIAHHFNDNLETYLIRKINGSNLEGLNSMNVITLLKNIQIIRPLIKVKKLAILDFNKKFNIKFINDPSNKDIQYTRVKIRDFLLNKVYYKIVKKEFMNLKKQIPAYKKMIMELLIYSLLEVKLNSIKINYKVFISNDSLIIERHVDHIINFLKKERVNTKSSKIKIFINLLKKPNFKYFNLKGVLIHKNNYILTFSHK